MKIEFVDNALYLRYLRLREELQNYYCVCSIGDIVKGYYYKCEILNEDNVRVYSTHKGKIISMAEFKAYFRKHSKLRQKINEFLDFFSP